MPEQQNPYCLAMLLCDKIQRDNGSGKYDLVGTFSRLRSNGWPTRAKFSVYFAVTDGFGTVPLSLKFVDSQSLIDHRDPVAHVDTEVVFQDPMTVVEGAVQLDMEFESPGLYYCELFTGGELLMSRRLLVDGPAEVATP